MDCSLNECGVCASESVVAFCENCNFRICETCFQMHKKSTKLFQNHVAFVIEKTKTIKDPSIADDTREISKESLSDIHTQKCATHTSENLVFFCTEHTETLCGRCLFSRHKSCKVVDLFEVHVDDREVSVSKSHLQSLVENLKSTEKKIEKNTYDNNVCKLEFLKDLQQLRTDVIAWFDRHQSKCEKQCNETFETNVERFKQVRTFCQDHIKRIQDRHDLIDSLLTRNHVKQLYVLLNQIKQEIEEVQLKLSWLNSESTFNGYVFKRSTCIEEWLNADAFEIGGLEEWCSGSDEILDDTLSSLKAFSLGTIAEQNLSKCLPKPCDISDCGKRREDLLITSKDQLDLTQSAPEDKDDAHLYPRDKAPHGGMTSTSGHAKGNTQKLDDFSRLPPKFKLQKMDPKLKKQNSLVVKYKHSHDDQKSDDGYSSSLSIATLSDPENSNSDIDDFCERTEAFNLFLRNWNIFPSQPQQDGQSTFKVNSDLEGFTEDDNNQNDNNKQTVVHAPNSASGENDNVDSKLIDSEVKPPHPSDLAIYCYAMAGSHLNNFENTNIALKTDIANNHTKLSDNNTEDMYNNTRRFKPIKTENTENNEKNKEMTTQPGTVDIACKSKQAKDKYSLTDFLKHDDFATGSQIDSGQETNLHECEAETRVKETQPEQVAQNEKPFKGKYIIKKIKERWFIRDLSTRKLYPQIGMVATSVDFKDEDRFDVDGVDYQLIVKSNDVPRLVKCFYDAQNASPGQTPHLKEQQSSILTQNQVSEDNHKASTFDKPTAGDGHSSACGEHLQTAAAQTKQEGDQPPGKMTVKQIHGFCTGYETVGKIRINYDFFGGRQLETHPSPGKMYEGISRTAYLPDNEQGRNICKMLKVAFERKLVFTIGDSRRTGHDGVITWNDIHHKTDYRAYRPFGYPDPTYLERVTDELKAKGVTLDDINPTDKLEGIITTD